MIRLRQIAFAARDLAAGEAALANMLHLDLCFRDPGVITFGLANALYPVGDQFLEIVSPVAEHTTAGRELDKRGGDCGYMALFQVDDLEPVAARLADLGVRVVFDARAEGIRGLHLHPKDVPGAIVSVDAADESAEWPWAGPVWRDHVDVSRVSSIVGMTVGVDDPTAACAMWAAVLGATSADNTIVTDDATTRFRTVGSDQRRGIVQVDFAATNRADAGTSHDLLGVTVVLV